MNVLLIGSGGREHAISELLLRSPQLGSLSVAPGNAGTRAHNVGLDVEDNAVVVKWCVANSIDLVVVGPEIPLVNGLADSLTDAGVLCFGPSRAAAQLEGSKAFARAFADRFDIASPISRSFESSEEAIHWFDEAGFDVVVKADGLAAGKGVIIPQDRAETIEAIESMLDHGALGASGSTILLEERMSGEELSLFGISDGVHVVALATAQDHKRVGDGDSGPNTGGMGAFAPVPGITATRQAELSAQFLEPAIVGMATLGSPYVGVLYAGIMLTEHGPRLIEYNCRFGDPEAQVILPLVVSDGLELFAAAASQDLARVRVVLDDRTAATVVVCAQGYPAAPARGVPVPSISARPGVTVFHAGTTFDDRGALISNGGRVMAVTGIGADLDAALSKAYEVVGELTGDGLFARTDIGWRHSAVRGQR